MAAMALLLAAVVTGCGTDDDGDKSPAAPPTAANAASPTGQSVEALVRQLVDAINRGDLEGAVALFGEDASWERGGRCPPNQCKGRERIKSELQIDVRNNHRLTIASAQAAGDTATARIELQTEGTRMAGVTRIIQIFTVSAADGRITAFRAENDLTDQVTADFVSPRRQQ